MAQKRRSHGMGGLSKVTVTRTLKDGTQREYVRWRGTVQLGLDPATGKRRVATVEAATQAAAKRKLVALQKEVAKGAASVKGGKTTLTAWVDQYMKQAERDLRPNTIKGYKSAWNAHIKPLMGHRRLNEVGTADAYALREAIIDEKGLAASTARQATSVLSAFLSAAVAEGMLVSNPIESVKKIKAKSVVHKDALTPEQVRAFAAVAPPRWLLALFGGLRQSEALGAPLAMLHLDDPRGPWLDVSRQVVEVRGDARVPDGDDYEHMVGRFWSGPLKAGDARVVPLLPVLAQALSRHADTLTGPNPHGLLFPQPDGKPRSVKQDNADLKRTLQAAGLDGLGITSHWLRHTAATILAASGDTHTASQILGNSRAVLEAIYRHQSHTERVAAMQGWAEVIRPQIEG